MKSSKINLKMATMLFVFFIFVLQNSVLHGETKVVNCPDMTVSLSERWGWAKKTISDFSDGCWVGYSIYRLMSENSWIGSFKSSDTDEKPTLRLILESRENDLSLKQLARKELENMEDKKSSDIKVEKEVALLFYFDIGSANFEDSENFKISNIDLVVDLKEKPLLWLGNVPQIQSVNFLVSNYKKVQSLDVKEDIITAISLHGESHNVLAFLEDIAKNEKSDELRKNAVFWLSQHPSDDVIDILLTTIQDDRSLDVREHAVFAISQIKTEDATDVLIHLARNAKDDDIQEQAIFWLSQKAAERTVEVLEDVVYDEEELEMKKQAVFALSQLSEGMGVSSLIKIAKEHSNSKIRKNAIFWLGQTNDPRALETIISLVKN